MSRRSNKNRKEVLAINIIDCGNFFFTVKYELGKSNTMGGLVIYEAEQTN